MRIATLVLVLSSAAFTAAAPQGPSSTADSAPTFSRDVAPIVYSRCASCHRAGEVAPMSLLSYREVRPWAAAIREQVRTRAMPPWHADRQHGRFRNDLSLSTGEIDTIVRWVDGGAREGDPAATPPAPKFADGWQIGTPDVVFQMAQEYEIPARGTIDYQYFEVPTNFTEDRWMQAGEVRAGDRAHVHHIIVYVREPQRVPRPTVLTVRPIASAGQAAAPAASRPAAPAAPRQAPRAPAGAAATPRGGDNMLVNWAVGEDAPIHPPGTAKRIPAGSTLIFQVHYTTNGTPGRDRSRVGLIFAKEPPEHEVRTGIIANASFAIPPGAADHLVEAEATFSEDAKVWSMHPHMHLRGKDMTYTAIFPDGRSEIVLRVPTYDFGWQTDYWLAEPLVLPKGSKLRVTAHFDNSPANRNNPDPAATVRWGDQTWEEMMIGFITYTAAAPAATARQEATTTACTVAALQPKAPAGTLITAAAIIAANGAVPEHCQVDASVATPGNTVNFRLGLPAAWNTKFYFEGVGGFAGSIGALRAGLERGYASASTDTGHQGSVTDASWALNNPAKELDFAHRGTHASAVAAKALSGAYYGSAPRHAYFNGCSNGGRQALLEAQRYPDDFDGVIAGNPSFGTLGQIQRALIFQTLMSSPDHVLPPAKVTLLSKAVVNSCDASDGLVDGLISDPRACTFQPETLVCKGADGPDCLTRGQIETVKAIYSDVRAPGGVALHGFPMGHEDGTTGWQQWITGATPAAPQPDGRMAFPGRAPNGFTFMEGYLRYLSFPSDDPDFDFRTFSFERHGPALKASIDAFSPTSADLSPFRKAGGKLIVYHGWADPGLSAAATIAYYDDVVRIAGGRQRSDEFVTLFMAPGMHHCQGNGPGPNRFDMLTALEQWVEQGVAPSRVIASHATGGVVDRTRPLCAFPQTARYVGTGSIDAAENFRCENPSTPATAFTAQAGVAAARAAAAPASAAVPKTPWGEPDLQGTWSSEAELSVPFERPREYGERQVLTDAEFAQRLAQTERQLQSDNADFDLETADRSNAGAVGSATSPPPHWLERGKTSRRTSIVVDPPDGRIPPLVPEAQKRGQGPRGTFGGSTFNSAQDLSLWERCISRGMPTAIFPTVYNANVRIVQGPGVVALTYEMIHDTRIIPIGDAPHVGSGVRGYFGDSRGRWEGNTLVVDVTNVIEQNNYRGARETLHLVERFTRVDAETLRYEVTADDPRTWTRPWTAALDMAVKPEGLFEYACHEGNHSMRNILSAARAAETK